jgi:hypothetical protein
MSGTTTLDFVGVLQAVNQPFKWMGMPCRRRDSRWCWGQTGLGALKSEKKYHSDGVCTYACDW